MTAIQDTSGAASGPAAPSKPRADERLRGNPSPKSPPSLVRRLVVLHAVLSALVMLAGGIALSASFSQQTTVSFDQSLGDDLIPLISGAAVDDQGAVSAGPLTEIRAQNAYSGKYWEMATVDATGRLRSIPDARSRSLMDEVIPAPASGAAQLLKAVGSPMFYDAPGPAGQPLRVAAQAVKLTGVAAPVIFMEAEDRSAMNSNIRTFETETGLSMAVLLAMLIAGVALQVRVGLRPLFELRREVAAVRTGKLDQVAGDYPAELEPLASELNALVAHNQEVIERQRTHVGNLAHALKTPLSVMAAEAQARPGALADVVRRQADVMREQVDHHLRRARAAARPQGGGERTEVAPVLEELARTLERIFRDKTVVIDWRAADDLYFHGERQDLLELAGNVMENACKWCVARVRVEAAPISTGLLRLVIEDDGPGLAAEDRGEVLQRGARLDETAPGSGLGLSIVDELARAYGGSLSMADSSLGGLKVTLLLPRAEA